MKKYIAIFLLITILCFTAGCEYVANSSGNNYQNKNTKAPSVTENEKFGLKKDVESMNKEEIEKEIKRLDKEMKVAARDLQFERAAQLRDIIIEMKKSLI